MVRMGKTERGVLLIIALAVGGLVALFALAPNQDVATSDGYPTAVPWIITPPPGFTMPSAVTSEEMALKVVLSRLDPRIQVLESHVQQTRYGAFQQLRAGPDAILVTLAPNETPITGDPRSEYGQMPVWVVGIKTSTPIGMGMLTRAVGMAALVEPQDPSSLDSTDGDEVFFVVSSLGDVFEAGGLNQVFNGTPTPIEPWVLSDIESLTPP